VSFHFHRNPFDFQLSFQWIRGSSPFDGQIGSKAKIVSYNEMELVPWADQFLFTSVAHFRRSQFLWRGKAAERPDVAQESLVTRKAFYMPFRYRMIFQLVIRLSTRSKIEI
jgi:hypothetical protein